MTLKRKTIATLVTVVMTVFAFAQLYALENFLNSDAACGCSSACTAMYPVLSSRLIGYGLMFLSFVIIIAAVWKFKRGLTYTAIIAVVVFTFAFYGNGRMLFDKGPCGRSLNLRTWYIFQEKLGDYAKPDGETLYLDSLSAGAYKGKLLGYALEGSTLTLFRIAEAPLKVRTGFLFWKIPGNVIVNHISYGLNTWRNTEAEGVPGHFEFIGGMGMTEKHFTDDFVTQKYFNIYQLKNKRIVNHPDGTVRFLFEYDTAHANSL